MAKRRPIPKVVFRLNKKRVEVVGQSERQAEQRKQIQVRRRKALGPLGPRIAKSKRKAPLVTVSAVPRGAKKKRRIKRIRVLVKARIRGRKAFFTRQLVFPGKRGAKSVKETLPVFLDSVIAAYSRAIGDSKGMQLLHLKVDFDTTLKRAA